MERTTCLIIIQTFCLIRLSSTSFIASASTTSIPEASSEGNVLQTRDNDIAEITGKRDMSNLGLKGLDESMFVESDTLNELNLSHNKLTSMKNVVSALWGIRPLILNLSYNNLGNWDQRDERVIEYGLYRSGKTFIFDSKYFWSVNLSHNGITEIGINFDVMNLDLSNNGITCHNAIETRGNPVKLLYIGDLNLSHNFINCQSKLFTPKINSLDMSYNNLEGLEANGLLRGLTQLTKLNLSHNNIQYIHPQAFVETVRLQRLDLQSNRIRNIYKQVWSPLAFIRYIDVSSNRLVYSEWDTDFVQKPATEIIVNVNNNTNSRWSSNSIEFRFCNGYLYSNDHKILGCMAFHDNVQNEYLLRLNDL